MEDVYLKKFRRMLKARQRVATHDLGAFLELIAVERSADAMDQTGRCAERDFAILGINRRSELLHNIQAALRRVEKGTFGGCTNCDETIGLNRLMAIPWAHFCIRCQEAIDGGDTKMIEPPYYLDVYAA